MKQFKKLASAILSTVICIALLMCSAYTGVFAAEGDPTAYNVADLATAGTVKTLGRTTVSDGKFVCDWPATGFEANVTLDASSKFSVTVDANYKVYVDIFVDGVWDCRTLTNADKHTVTTAKSYAAGDHLLRVIRDSQPSSTVTSLFAFVSVSFAGTFGERPADNDLYYEFIGDSYCCGDGAYATYSPGVKWSEPADDSVVNSYGYTAAKELGADYSIVARGGIGLTMGSAQQDLDDKVSINKVYNFANYRDFRNEAAEYDFAGNRKPNAVVIEIGGNDGWHPTTDLSYGGQKLKQTDVWKLMAKAFIDQIREKYNDENLPIIWMTTGGNWEQYMYMRSLDEADPNLYSWRYYQGGNGSAAKETQTAGHPSGTQQQAWGKALAAHIKTLGLAPEKVVEVETQKDKFEVWVDDVTEENHYTNMYDAEVALFALAATSSKAAADIDAIIHVPYSDTPIVSGNTESKNVLFGYDASSAAKKVTVQIIGELSPEGKKPVVYTSYCADGTYRKFTQDYRFENIILTNSGETGYEMTTMYLNTHTVVFDEGTEIHSSAAPETNSFATIYGGTTSNSKASGTASKGNITFNSDDIVIENVYPIGINRVGATYNEDATGDAKYPTDTKAKAANFYFTMNKGNIGTLAAGTTGFVARKAATVYYTINGGNITNFYAGGTADNKNIETQTFNANVTLNGGTVDKYYGIAYTTANAYGGNYTITYNGANVKSFVNGLSGATTTCGNYTFNMKSGTLGTATTTFYPVGKVKTANNVTVNISGGRILAKIYYTMPSSSTVNKITTNMTGGEIQAHGTQNKEGIYFGGSSSLKVAESITNNISDGNIFNVIDSGTCSSQTYFGAYSIPAANMLPRLINNVSGGLFMTYYADGVTKSGTKGIYFGCYSGGNIVSLENNISGGIFDFSPVGGSTCYLGAGQAVGNHVEKITNVIGVKGKDVGPVFSDTTVSLASGWGRVGKGVTNSTVVTDDNYTSYDTSEDIIKNTVHYMQVNDEKTVQFAPSGRTVKDNYYSYVLGNVVNVINDGHFTGDVYLGGARVYGNVTSTINGGIFTNVYGAGASNTGDNFAKTFGDVTLNINGYNTYSTISKYSDSRLYCGGNGDITGHVSVNIDGGKFARVYGGTKTGDIADGVEFNITKMKSAGIYTDKVKVVVDDTFIAGSNTGTISLKDDSAYEDAISINITASKSSDKSQEGDVSIAGDMILGSYNGTVNGNVTANFAGGNNDQFTKSTACGLVLGNSLGDKNINGNVTLNVTKGGYYGGSFLKLGHNSAGSGKITGNVTYFGNKAHFGNVQEPVCEIDGEASITLSTEAGNCVVNGQTGASDKYKFHLIGGSGRITMTGPTRFYPDTVDISEEKPLNIYQYANWDIGTCVVSVSGDYTDAIDATIKSGITTALVTNFDGEKTNVVAVEEAFEGAVTNFALDDALTANVLYPAEGAVETVIASVGGFGYNVEFMGETYSGKFTAESPLKTVDSVNYYAVAIPVPTGKFDEALTIDGETVTVRELLEAGKEIYSGTPEAELFDAIDTYGAEVAAMFYGGEKPVDDYADVDAALVSEYNTTPEYGLNSHMVGTNLLLLDKINPQLYLKLADGEEQELSFKLNGVELNANEYELKPVSISTLPNANFLLSVAMDADEMTNEFTIEIVKGGVTVDSFTASIGWYCATYIENAPTNVVAAANETLAKAILRYLSKVDACFAE